MHSFRPFALAALAAAATLGLASASLAGVLYKSVDRDGRVTFSDAPLEGAIAVQRLSIPDIGMPVVAEASASAPKVATASDPDTRIAQANAKVDMAERALALARRSVWAENEGLTLASPRRTEADRQRIEFYKREHLAARKELMQALRSRNQQPARTELAGLPRPAA